MASVLCDIYPLLPGSVTKRNATNQYHKLDAKRQETRDRLV